MYCCVWWRCLRWKQTHFLIAIKPRLDQEKRYGNSSSATTVKFEVSAALGRRNRDLIGLIHTPLFQELGALGPHYVGMCGVWVAM